MLNALEAMKVSDSSLQLQSRWCLHHQQLVQARICRLGNRKWRIKNVHLFQIWDKKLILFPLKLFQDGLSKMKYKNALSRRYITFYGTLQTGHTNNQSKRVDHGKAFFSSKIRKTDRSDFPHSLLTPFSLFDQSVSIIHEHKSRKNIRTESTLFSLKKNNLNI